ncbi:MAG: cell division topological specificity factor MinE [Lachnospiraceae bacterium]|nr:cell division topological specificity factor MinE [Lachnospiraceae bacterium]MCD7767096.1 cell division topological specificity factor MinE [Lachnospiraceae bacterium]
MKWNPKRMILTSGKIARTRAGLTVSADRLDFCPERMAELRREVTDVLAKYINTEDENIKICITFACDTTASSLTDPLQGSQTRGSGPDRKRGISDVKTIQIK